MTFVHNSYTILIPTILQVDKLILRLTLDAVVVDHSCFVDIVDKLLSLRDEVKNK